MKTILVVDDEAPVRDVLRFCLERAGYVVEGAATARNALRELDNYVPDMVMLDVGLPDMSGLELLHTWRREDRTRGMPVIIVTGRGEERDRVNGLRGGADDYVTKPFSAAELLSRVRAILRRRELDRANGGSAVRDLGGLHIDLSRHEVLVDGARVHLTLSEFKVLALLAEQPAAVVSRKELMQHLWASEHVGDEHACEVHISNLRRKIERDASSPERLLTVRGLGYKLVPV